MQFLFRPHEGFLWGLAWFRVNGGLGVAVRTSGEGWLNPMFDFAKIGQTLHSNVLTRHTHTHTREKHRTP